MILMRMRDPTASQKERAIIERQVQHLIRLVDDLLDVSRITRGKLELTKRQLELGEVVSKAIEMVSPLLEKCGHVLKTDVPAAGLMVNGDEMRLGQVVANLLENAAKYTPPGGKIEITAAATGGRAELRVCDWGRGISPALLPRLFDQFVQGERAPDRSEGGLGLGLTIVRSLVELHGGTVTAASAGIGQGSQFTVYLPLAKTKLAVGAEWLLTVALRDVTERQRLERELVDARKFLENVLESSTEYGIIAKDLERKILVWNEGAARLYGYSSNEMRGQSSDILHAPEDVLSGAVGALHQRALAEGRAHGLFRRRRKDGSGFLARVMITRRDDSNGNPIGYLHVSHDVTAEQRHAEAQKFLTEVGSVLAGTLDYEETLINVANLVVRKLADVCIVEIVEEDDVVRRLKVACRDPNKATVADALQRMQLDRRRPHLASSVPETKQSLLMSEVTPESLESVTQSDEHRKVLRELGPKSLMALPLVAHDRLVGVLILISTTEAQRYMPEDLDLAEEVARRAAMAVENARLYRTAQRATQTRDDVLGIVAHDLRNPLGSILMQANLLGRRGPEPDRRSRKPAATIERAATRMNHLIQDLLDITRMEAGRLAMEQARVPAGQVVSESVEAQKALASSSSLELRLDLARDLPEVWADRDRLLQVFENLIGNALKFTEPGGRIVVGAAPRDDEVLFWVADTGSGIASEDVPHLFDRFWQARKDGRHGAGLGLPIVKGIVEAHGGRIWVESTPGRGSTFFFTIPTALRAEAWQHEPAGPFGA